MNNEINNQCIQNNVEGNQKSLMQSLMHNNNNNNELFQEMFGIYKKVLAKFKVCYMLSQTNLRQVATLQTVFIHQYTVISE